MLSLDEDDPLGFGNRIHNLPAIRNPHFLQTINVDFRNSKSVFG